MAQGTIACERCSDVIRASRERLTGVSSEQLREHRPGLPASRRGPEASTGGLRWLLRQKPAGSDGGPGRLRVGQGAAREVPLRAAGLSCQQWPFTSLCWPPGLAGKICVMDKCKAGIIRHADAHDTVACSCFVYQGPVSAALSDTALCRSFRGLCDIRCAGIGADTIFISSPLSHLVVTC